MNKRILSLIVCFALAICSMPLDRVRAQENNSTITVLSYTREIDTSKVRNGRQHGMYEALTTDSMHLAYSYDGVTYEALNYNTGVLFAKNEALLTKCLLQPYIFRMKDNSFGVVAIRINEGESRSDAVGQIIFFTSEDLIDYTEVGMVSLGSTEYVSQPMCEYDKEKDRYNIIWTGEESGVNYMNYTSDFSTVSSPEQTEKSKQHVEDTNVEYAIESNTITLNAEEFTKLKNRMLPVKNTLIEDKIVETTIGTPIDLSGQRVNALYTDGSSASKAVTWNKQEMDAVNFNKEGTYTVTGQIRQLADKISETGNYPFLAGRADPNMVKYNDKYYFIATNESGNVNLYIKESDTVAGINDAEDHLVYDEAKGAEGGIVSISNHWAPELHVINNDLYMFFASNVGTGWDVQCLLMKLKTGGDPKKYNDWEAPQRFLDKDGKMLNSYYGGITLDMTYFNYNNRHYVVWSQRNFGKNSGTADLWIGEIRADKPYQLVSDPVLIVNCEYGWERIHQTVTEGPFVIITDDVLYMTYSGGATDETYCVGLTQINLNGSVDFLDPSQWKKTNYPILTGLSSQGDDKYHGPGHNSYVVDEDDYLVNVFHARPGNGTAFARDTFLRIVHFGIDGTPILDMEEKSEILPENKMVTMQIVVSKKAVASPIPTSVPVVPTAAPPATTPPAEVISKKDFIVGKLVYKVTSTSSGKETVQVTKPVKKTNKTITVPATVKYNGKTYKVTTIANKAFQKNVNLQKVTIGKNVTQIGSKAFYGNKKIKSVFIKTKVLKKVGKSAFKNINKKVSFRVPASKKTAYRKFW